MYAERHGGYFLRYAESKKETAVRGIKIRSDRKKWQIRI
jgi:hypothetical protein